MILLLKHGVGSSRSNGAVQSLCGCLARSRGAARNFWTGVSNRNLSRNLAARRSCYLDGLGRTLSFRRRLGRENRAQEAAVERSWIAMTVLLPILPAVLLGAFCWIACYLSLRKVDQFLEESSQPDGAKTLSAGTEPPLRIS